MFNMNVFQQMLSKSLDVVQSEDWVAELGETFGEQVSLYNNYPEEKVHISRGKAKFQWY